MRSAVIAAAFVTGALAVPYQKRDVVTDTAVNVVYATEVVTVTQGSEPTTTAEAVTTQQKHWGHHWGWTSKWTWTEAATTEAPAPTSTEAPSTYEAPSSTPEATTQAPAPTSTAAAPSSQTSEQSSTPTGDVSGYQDIAVYHHNIHRSNHSAPDLVWDSGLANTASKIAQSCKYAHNTEMDGGGYGQNIAAGVEPNNISAIITDLFYNGEEPYYNGMYGQAQPSMIQFELWGHFSQIVWKSTTKVGCATQDCSSQGLQNVGDDVAPYFTVCNYDSPGNYANEYGDNVLQPKGMPTAQWNTGLASS